MHTRTAPRTIALLSVLLIGGLASCRGGTGDGDGNPGVIDGGGQEDAGTVVSTGEGLDILFVIDNSGSMREEQESLLANFNRLVNALNNLEGGLPDVHIGVVSTNIGAGPYGIMGCEGNGDNGQLLSTPRGACTPPSPEPFIKDVASADGLSRITNYEGDLASTFSCIAALGTAGCGFEQPLEAMRRALNGSNAQNSGFLREEAFLAVIIISDEDDCSVEDVSMFDSNPALDTIDSSVGPLSSFRCFEFGVQCQPDTPRTAGPRQDCVPRASSQYMYDVGEYANFLKGLKDNPGNIVVAGIIGNPTPVGVGSNDGEPTLEPSCESASGSASPGVRLQAFLDAFPQRNTSTTICNDDLSDAIGAIADLLTTVVGS